MPTTEAQKRATIKYRAAHREQYNAYMRAKLKERYDKDPEHYINLSRNNYFYNTEACKRKSMDRYYAKREFKLMCNIDLF